MTTRTVIVGFAWLGVAAHVLVPAAIQGGVPAATLATSVGGIVLVLTLMLCIAIPERVMLLEQPCLLVPTGCALGLQTLTQRASPWQLIASSTSGAAISAVLCVQIACMLLICLLHAAWLTPMIVRVARGERAADALLPALHAAPALMGRTFCTLVLGCAPMLLLVPFVLGPPQVVLVLIVLLVVVTPLWNLLTATLLLRSLDPLRKDWLGYGAAMVSAWRQRDGWRGVLFAQLALLGFVVILPMQFKVQMLWVGGYDAENRWYSVAAEKSGGWPPLGALLELAGTVLAIAIKLRIARCIELARVPGATLSSPAAAAGHR